MIIKKDNYSRLKFTEEQEAKYTEWAAKHDRVLTLAPEHLRYSARKKPLDEIDLFDFRVSKEQIQMADKVIYYPDFKGGCIVLKNRFGQTSKELQPTKKEWRLF